MPVLDITGPSQPLLQISCSAGILPLMLDNLLPSLATKTAPALMLRFFVDLGVQHLSAHHKELHIDVQKAP